MTKTTAIKKGLVCAGYYERSKNQLLSKLQDIRNQSYKAFIVTMADNPLSRGTIGVGYSIYTEPRYSQDQQATDIKRRIANHDKVLNQLKDQYDQEVARENAKHKERIDWLTEHGYTLD